MQKFPKDPDMYVFFGDLQIHTLEMWFRLASWGPGGRSKQMDRRNQADEAPEGFFSMSTGWFLGWNSIFCFYSVEQPGGLTFEKIKKSIHIYIYDYIWPIFSGAAFAIQLQEQGVVFTTSFFQKKKSPRRTTKLCAPVANQSL